MKMQSHTITVKGIKPSQIWQLWTDINNWGAWDTDIEWAKLKGPFKTGAVFQLKPKKGPAVDITIVEAIPLQKMMDCTRFPGARMYGIHDMQETAEGLQITTAMKMEGPLTWLWWQLVGKKVAAGIPEQTERLIQLAKQSS